MFALYSAYQQYAFRTDNNAKYYPEELKEIQKAMVRNLSEEEKKVVFARQVEELKQNTTSVLNAMAMQKAAEKVEEK